MRARNVLQALRSAAVKPALPAARVEIPYSRLGIGKGRARRNELVTAWAPKTTGRSMAREWYEVRAARVAVPMLAKNSTWAPSDLSWSSWVVTSEAEGFMARLTTFSPAADAPCCTAVSCEVPEASAV